MFACCVHILVTASLGLATIEPGSPSVEIYERADRMLYEAKAKGRNRVLVAA
jgi:PleD family two-component response regulator